MNHVVTFFTIALTVFIVLMLVGVMLLWFLDKLVVSLSIWRAARHFNRALVQGRAVINLKERTWQEKEPETVEASTECECATCPYKYSLREDQVSLKE